MKFKFFRRIAVIYEQFLSLLNMLRGPDMTRYPAGFGTRAAGSPLQEANKPCTRFACYPESNFIGTTSGLSLRVYVCLL